MIKLIIDSASDINEIEAKQLGITMVAMEVMFGEEQYFDGVNLTPSQFYDKLVENDQLPKTSLINTFRWEEEFEKATKNGDEVIAITISSKLSGTYQSAVEASKKFKGVYVVDSLNACIGERLLCQYAMRLISQNLLAEQIVEKLNTAKTKINLMAMLNTLKYLKKGGRISAAVAIAGEVFSIKPVVGVVDGEVKLIGKAMGSKKGNNLLSSLVEKKGIDFDMPYGVIYSGTDKSVLDKYVADSSHLWKDSTNSIPQYMIGCTIGTHIGPGAIGVAFFEK